MLFSQHLNWKLLAFLSERSNFDLKHYSEKHNKIKIIKPVKILK